MIKQYKQIFAGFFFLLGLACLVFFALSHYMDSRTAQDVRRIAHVHLQGMLDQEKDRFEAIKAIRRTQMNSLKDALRRLDIGADGEAVKATIVRAALFQNLANCSLVEADGTLSSVYGAPIVKLGDPDFLLKGILSGREIVTGGWTAREQLIIYAASLSVPMPGGKRSAGILWCKPIPMFQRMMNLDNPESLVVYRLIRRDGSYVVQSRGAGKDDYYSNLLAYCTPELRTVGQAVDDMKRAVASGGVFEANGRYVNAEDGVDERRSVRGAPLKDSNWYFVGILPYGVLDEVIEGMGTSMARGAMSSAAVLAAGILLVFLLYLRMVRGQMEEARDARKKAEKAQVAAEHANRTKSEFLSNMSHDIRTPMNAIVGLTSIARDHVDDVVRVDSCLKKIMISGKQLLGLINDVLDMSKIESGKMTLKLEEISLRETMETMCDIVRPQIRDKGQNFDVHISNILSENVYCDGVRLNQVLLNFLSNAMKFTPEGGRVDIELWQERSPKGAAFVRTHFVVRDTGIGMSEEFKSKIFTAFEREDSRRVHRTQGTGLGMAISKYIVDAMGGSIEVESAPGKGTCFHVAVDLERAAETGSDMKLPPWNILVVDDSAELRRTAELSLRDLGTRPQTCRSGEEAVELLQKAHAAGGGGNYFAALIDYKMDGGMSGVQTAVKLRELLGENVPLLLISAYDWDDIEGEARKASIDGFIPKPLFKSTLYRALKRFRDGAEADAENGDPAEERPSLDGLRVLLAEDQPINAEIAIAILEEAGTRVDHAEDGAVAASRFRDSAEGWYDVVLMDLRMPHMDGIAATKTIRAMKRSDAGTVPIIALTADAFAEDAQRCIDAGMDAHMAKPIDVKLLLRKLAELRRHRTDESGKA
ncbi:MAG: response regulator [Desulfovibrio sp.]|nr:response regulator [Desulfovibrio sp.]